MFSKSISIVRPFTKTIQSPQVRALSSLEGQRRYVPRRDLMYVPGSDLRKVEKIPKMSADCVCIDCEDGVAINMKEQASILWNFLIVTDAVIK